MNYELNGDLFVSGTNSQLKDIEKKEIETIIDTNWGNRSKKITIESGYLYIVFVCWNQYCLLYQYANGTQVTRDLNGTGGYSISTSGNVVTIDINNTGVMYGIRVKIT